MQVFNIVILCDLSITPNRKYSSCFRYLQLISRKVIVCKSHTDSNSRKFSFILFNTCIEMIKIKICCPKSKSYLDYWFDSTTYYSTIILLNNIQLLLPIDQISHCVCRTVQNGGLLGIFKN